MKTTRCVHRNRQGFTLIELLTVIAIIGILAAIIIPTVGKVRQTAKSAQCASNVRQLCMALRLYAESNKGNLPLPGADAGVGADWANSIRPMLPNNSENRGQVHICPNADYGITTRPLSYTYSMAGGAVGLNSVKNDNNGGVYRPLASIQNPSRAPWVVDGGLGNATYNTGRNAVNYSGTQSFTASVNTDVTDPQPVTSAVQFRHSSRAVFGFADGSVRSLNRQQAAEAFPTPASFIGFQR